MLRVVGGSLGQDAPWPGDLRLDVAARSNGDSHVGGQERYKVVILAINCVA